MISFAVIHNPRSTERVENVRALLSVLPEAVVVEDDGTGVGRKWNRLGCWPVASQAWRMVSADHHVVLEDDAELCGDFVAHVERIASMVNACVSLFHGARDCSVGTMMPRWLVDRWLNWTSASPRGARFLPHHDYLITQGMCELGVRHLYTEPSLLDQRPFASMLGHRHVSALRFDQSPTEVSVVVRP